MTLQQTIIRDLATLDEGDLTQVAQYLSFLKFRPSQSPAQRRTAGMGGAVS